VKRQQSESRNGNAFRGQEKPLGDVVVDYAYGLLLASRMYTRTKAGLLMHRKEARLILANNIKINRFFFDAIVSEMARNGLARNGNHGIYLAYRRDNTQ
jgi:hypothetical protein